MNVTKQTPPTRAICNRIYEWCVKRYGRSKFNGSYPKLRFTKYFFSSKDHKNSYAYYQPWKNEISINKNNNKTTYEVIDSIIHEWVHYLQPIKSHLNKQYDRNGYDKDPLEKQAIRIAKKDSEICYLELFKKL